MEKEMLVVAKLKEGMFEKFMGFMQSPEVILHQLLNILKWPLHKVLANIGL